MNQETKEVPTIDLFLGEIAFKDTLPLLARVSEGNPSMTATILQRCKAFRNAFLSKNAPTDDALLGEWVAWAEIKER